MPPCEVARPDVLPVVDEDQRRELAVEVVPDRSIPALEAPGPNMRCKVQRPRRDLRRALGRERAGRAWPARPATFPPTPQGFVGIGFCKLINM